MGDNSSRRCTSKARYPNREAAERMGIHYRDIAGYELYIYKCDLCDGYHLSKQKWPSSIALPVHIKPGFRAGRVTVLGKSDKQKYVTQCDCGQLVKKSATQLRKTPNAECCDACRNKANAIRSAGRARLGVDIGHLVGAFLAFAPVEMVLTGRLERGKPVVRVL